MNTRTFTLCVAAVLLGLLLVPDLAHAQDKWEYVTKEQGVRVYTKEVKGSDLKAFRGKTVVNVHIGKIMSVFLDETQRKHWVDRYETHKTLEKDDLRQVYWIHFDLPFPTSDRDYVLESVGDVDADKGVVTVRIKSVKHAKKGKDDCCVRARAYGTYYRFEAVPGKEQTKMTVEVHTDPKGWLPDWLVNSIQEGWPSKTLGGLVKRARKVNKIDPDYADWHDAKE